MRGLVVVLAGAAWLGGCSMGDDVPLAEKGIAAFHKSVDAGQFDAIWQGAGQDMKNATSEVALDRLLSAVHRKLGAFKSGKSLGWNDNHSMGGHFVTVNYAATYARGAAEESFVYRIDDGHAALAGYHVNSDALILN